MRKLNPLWFVFILWIVAITCMVWLLKSDNPALYVSVTSVAAAVYGYFFNAERERAAQKIAQRKEDYGAFLSLLTKKIKLRSAEEEDQLRKYRIQLLLTGSVDVVNKINDLIRASKVGPYQNEMLALVKQMRDECGITETIADADAFFLISTVELPGEPQASNGE